MKKFLLALVLGAFLAVPCMLRAEEIEIELTQVISMGGNLINPGDDPLDDPDKETTVHPRPNNFRATINGNSLSIQKLESSIPSAQATVVNATTGGIVVNEQFTTTLTEQISNSGVYVLHIQTDGGALVGQFVVQ